MVFQVSRKSTASKTTQLKTTRSDSIRVDLSSSLSCCLAAFLGFFNPKERQQASERARGCYSNRLESNRVAFSRVGRRQSSCWQSIHDAKLTQLVAMICNIHYSSSVPFYDLSRFCARRRDRAVSNTCIKSIWLQIIK